MTQPENIAPNDFLTLTGKFIRGLVSDFFQKDCQKSAAALTYMTLFALVPMMTVTYSMVSIFPVFNGVGDQLQLLIFKHFVPETGSEVQKYLVGFSQQARNLTLPGVVVLVVTAYLMLSSIEKTFNEIWNVRQVRTGLSSFLIYWAILSIGPLLLGSGLVMSTTILSYKLVVGNFDVMHALEPAFHLSPFLMTSAALILLFVAVPNCHVPLRAAVIGGVLTAICFEVAKQGFSAIVANSNYQLIYGAFAVVPLFLFWIYLLWMIVLVGAVFVKNLSEIEYQKADDQHTDMVAVLMCLEIFHRSAKSGDPVSDDDCLASGISLEHWNRLKKLMVEQKWISVTDAGLYVLSRDLKHLTLWDIAQATKMTTDSAGVDGGDQEWQERLYQMQVSIRDHARGLMGINLDELLSNQDVLSEN